MVVRVKTRKHKKHGSWNIEEWKYIQNFSVKPYQGDHLEKRKVGWTLLILKSLWG
jgi:hypothetical protein